MPTFYLHIQPSSQTKPENHRGICGCDHYLGTRLHCQTMILCKANVSYQSWCTCLLCSFR